MNWVRAAEKLGTTNDRLEELKDGVLRSCSWPYPRLYRFEKAAIGVEAGTVIFENGDVVFGYPKIKRAMILEPALKRHFKDSVAVEEKMNGYNVRVVYIDGEVVALTRGGYICPFSTEAARHLINPKVFYDNPDLVLCGEMVGPENPYVPKDIYSVQSIAFFLFDVAKKNQHGVLGVSKTHQLADEYGINHTQLFGEYLLEKAAYEITDIIKRLGKKGREGVIIKDPENNLPPIKYTSSQSNCSDLEYAFRYYNDYAADFLTSRVLREGFQSVEWNESDEERQARSLRLGESILKSLSDTIKRKKNQEQIVQQLQIRIKSIHTARDLEQHLRRSGIKAIFDIPEADGDDYVVRIIKLVMSTNDKTQAVLDGQLW